MRHPFAGKALRFYIIVWAVIITAHFFFLHQFAGFPPDKALLDAVIFNLLISGFGFVYWYVVKFLSPERQGITNLLISHFLGSSVGVFLTVYISRYLLSIPASADYAYLEFMRNSLILRLAIAFFYMAMIIMVYYLLQYRTKMQRKEQDEAALQNMLRNAELEMLKFQLNPHFIFNSLNSVSSLTITDPKKAHEMIVRLSDFLRSSLGKKHPEKHSLKEEMLQMNLYFEIEKVRFGERLVISQNIDDECNTMLLPNMMLQPLYENAIKHGLYGQLDALTIKTIASCSDKHLHITIRNNFDKEAVSDPGKGIGLKNVKNRLRILYGRDDLMQVNRENGIFEVHLSIPQL